jgi:beta-lactamase class A
LIAHLTRVAAVAAASLLGLASARAQAGAIASSSLRADTAALRRTLDSLASAHRGVVGYSVRDLGSGATLSLRGDETFPTASLIKVPILVTVFDLVEKKRLSLDDELNVLPIDKVGGSGVIQYLHSGIHLTVRDAAWLMTILSDNTATNLLLDRIVIRRVWEKMEALGLPHSKVHSKTFLRISSVAPDSSAKYGFGVTTPNEMSKLFELLARGKAVSAAADSTMLDILEHTDYNQMLTRFVDSVRVAHKYGADTAVRTECALFRLKSPVAACVLTKENVDRRWVLDNEPQTTVARMGQAIVKAFR